jgi:hypothetical protein
MYTVFRCSMGCEATLEFFRDAFDGLLPADPRLRALLEGHASKANHAEAALAKHVAAQDAEREEGRQAAALAAEDTKLAALEVAEAAALRVDPRSVGAEGGAGGAGGWKSDPRYVLFALNCLPSTNLKSQGSSRRR